MVRTLAGRLSLLLPVVVGVLGAAIGLLLWSPQPMEVGPFAVRLEAGLGAGRTTIELPPLGRITADSHDTPIAFTASLENVDVPKLTESLKGRTTADLVEEIEDEALGRVRPYAFRLLGVSLAGALGLGLLVFRNRWRRLGASVGVAAVLVGGSLAGAWGGYRPAAFREPSFTGTLALAPQIVGPAEEITNRIDDFRANLQRIVDGAVRAYTAIGPGVVSPDDEIRVLHLSDIHLSPLGIDFAVQLARGFDVSFVLDTGDLTSYGTPAEELILSQLTRFGRSYVFVRGNHDSPALRDEMRRLPNVRVLDGDLIELEGLRLYGLGHPVFTEDKEERAEPGTFAERARSAAATIRRDLRRKRVDVVAVHDDRMAETLAGRVPLVVSGHFHRSALRHAEGTVFLRAGSAGGAGVNMFEGDGVPLSAQVLYFERSARPRLVAYDLIRQSPESGLLVVQRHVVRDRAPGEASPTPR